ncbi:MAG: hypothetical protein JWL71_1155 [Acidobacteria bacterium]|nr:hypothetical protein [Acidobacteriota bacterium]
MIDSANGALVFTAEAEVLELPKSGADCATLARGLRGSRFASGEAYLLRCASAVAAPESFRIGLSKIDEPPAWWVTVDGRAVVGFSGDNAQRRAEQYFFQLLSISPTQPAAVRSDAEVPARTLASWPRLR